MRPSSARCLSRKMKAPAYSSLTGLWESFGKTRGLKRTGSQLSVFRNLENSLGLFKSLPPSLLKTWIKAPIHAVPALRLALPQVDPPAARTSRASRVLLAAPMLASGDLSKPMSRRLPVTSDPKRRFHVPLPFCLRSDQQQPFHRSIPLLMFGCMTDLAYAEH